MNPVDRRDYIKCIVFVFVLSSLLCWASIKFLDPSPIGMIIPLAFFSIRGIIGEWSKDEDRYKNQNKRHKSIINGNIYDTDFSERLWTTPANTLSFWKTNNTGKFFFVNADGITLTNQELIEEWMLQNLDADKASGLIEHLFGKVIPHA